VAPSDTTSNNARKVVESIRREIESARGTHIWDDYVNALRLISQVVFTRSSGFILELIQNAEDSGLDIKGSGLLEISINRQRVKVVHNGKPFDENDVRAISGIRSSKKPERGFLGYLGIGFKSVLKVTDHPEIYSSGYQFKFDRTCWSEPNSTPWHVIPIWIDKPSESVDESKTTFIIPFREGINTSQITEEIKKIRLGLYLFLRWLRTIKAVDETTGEHWKLENLGENQEGISTLKGDDEERRFKFFRREVEVPEWVKDDRLTQEYRANVTKREISIGFALDKNGNLAPEEAGAMYGGVYSFQPLGEARSGAKFPIQADFLVQPGRDALNYEAKWNHWLLQEIRNLCFEAIDFLKTHETWKYQFLPVFEFKKSTWLESYQKLFRPELIEPVGKHLAETVSILTEDDDWVKPSEVIRLTEEGEAIKDLLKKQLFSTRGEIAFAFSGKDNLKLAHPKFVDQERHLIEESGRQNLLENTEFLQTKTKGADAGKWFAKLYAWLQEHPEYKDVLGPRGGYKGQEIRRYYDFEFILTADNLLKRGGDVSIPDLPSNHPSLKEIATLLKSSKTIIHPDILLPAGDKDCEKVKGFLTGLCGVQILDAKKICKDMILPKIISKAPQPSPDELLSLTKLCKEILRNDLGEGIELWIRTKSGHVKTAKEVYLSSEFKPIRNWETHQEYIPGLNFIDSIYLTDSLSDDALMSWRDFFISAGVKENPDNGVEQFAINYALDNLKSKFNNVQHVEKLNYGYDIQAQTLEGGDIKIEVKGVSNERDVELTGNETEAADKYKDSFYLCIIADIPDYPKIHMVKNPAYLGKKDKLTIPAEIWKQHCF